MKFLTDFRRMRSALMAAIAVGVSLNILSAAIYAQAGSVDQSFKSSLEQIGGDVHVAEVQADGKVVVGGSFQFIGSGTRINIARLNADGSNDAAFNTGEGANSQVSAIAFQADGKIIVA